MKKFSKLLAVLVALAVIICPMTSAIVANATSGGTYNIEAENANDVVLTISSNDGFLVYQATVTFNSNSAFQDSYSSEGYTNGLKVIDYTVVSPATKDAYNAPAISAQKNGSSLAILVSATDAATLDLYSEIQIGIRVANGSTATLSKIQAADQGTVEEDPSLLNFGAKVAADGTVDTNNNGDATTGTTHEHNFTKDTPYEVTAPTCTAYGVYRKTCTVCGAVDPSGTYTGTTMAAHTPSNVQNATADFLASAATCTEPASYYYECTVCHDAIREGMAGYTGTFTSGSAAGHTMTAHSANAAGCETAGNSAYWSCSVCNKYFSDAQGNTEIAANSWVIGATGHTLTPTAATPATCTTAGNSAYWTCSTCGKYFSDSEGEHEISANSWVISATGVHTWGEYVSDGNATCAVDGTKTATCTVCGVATDTVTDTGSHLSVAHTYGEYVSNNDATCTVDGTKTRTCSVCGATDTVTDTGSAKGHSYTSYTYNNDATCTAAGTETASCDNGCGTTDTRTSAGHPALGHDYTYTSNEDGTHDVGCTRCDFADTEDCDTAGTDGACSKCGYKASASESVLDTSIVTLTPQISISETLNINFRATKATTTNNASYASTDMVIVATRYDGSGNLYNTEPVHAEFWSLTSKNNAATYYDVASYELNLSITGYVACYNALGVEVAHSAPVVVTPSDLLKALYKASPATEQDLATNKLVTDTLNLGTNAQVYFASQLSGSCDIKSAVYINAGWDQTYASGALTDLTDVSSFDWNSDSSITSTTNNITTGANISGAPVIGFNIMRAAPTGAAPLDFSKLSMTVSYNTIAANNGGAGTITDTVTGSDWNQYIVGKNLRYTFKKCAMYDSDKTVTAVITYDGVRVCTVTYSLDSYVSANKNSSSSGYVVTAIGRFSAAARNYFSVLLSKPV